MKVGELQKKINEQNKKASENIAKAEKPKDEKQKEPEKTPVDITEKEINAYLDKYMTGEPIEKTYSIRDKIHFVLRDPNAKMQEISDTVLFNNADIKVARFPTIVNNNMLAMYVIKYNDIDFIETQGDKYYTEEGFKERVDIMLKKINPTIRKFILSSIDDFIAILEAIFSNSSLKNL